LLLHQPDTDDTSREINAKLGRIAIRTLQFVIYELEED
jgi:hypothetical protein